MGSLKDAFVGVPKIAYINLDKDVDRRNSMEFQLKESGISNYIRIPAVGGVDAVLKAAPDYKKTKLTLNEAGCTASHLYALKELLTSDDPYFLIFEDDVSFDVVNNWSFNFKDLLKNLPKDWDSVQLCRVSADCTNTGINIKPWTFNFKSTMAYLVTREHAASLVDLYMFADEAYLTSYYSLPRKTGIDSGNEPWSDSIVYADCKSYSVNLFTSTLFTSSIRNGAGAANFERISTSFAIESWSTNPSLEDILNVR